MGTDAQGIPEGAAPEPLSATHPKRIFGQASCPCRRKSDSNARKTDRADVKQEGITEQLKAEQPMVWVGRMNSIHSRAEEIVREEIINKL